MFMLLLAPHLPLFVLLWIVAFSARRDAKAGFVGRNNAILRLLPPYPFFDPANNPEHEQIERDLVPDPRLNNWRKRHEVLSTELTQLPSLLWLLIAWAF